MRAAIKTGKEKFEIIDVPMPAMGEEDVLVRVTHCAICAWCYETWMADGENAYPGLTGHEVAGIIEQVGTKVKNAKIGDRVLVYNGKFCGQCDQCMEGNTTACRKAQLMIGGYADYVSSPELSLLPVPDSLPLGQAVMISDMVGTALHAIRDAFSTPRKRTVVAVWALGPVGLMAVQGVRYFEGVEKVIALDPVEHRRKVALALGADEVLDPRDNGIEEYLLSQNNGLGINYSFNCGMRREQDIDLAYRTLNGRGYLMNITGTARTVSQSPKIVAGSYYFPISEYPANLQLVLEGKIQLAPAISHEFPLESINEAMELRSFHPDQALKVVIRCSEGD